MESGLSLSIRQERISEYLEVEKVIEAAFKDMELSDQTEHQLVSKLRQSENFIPALSLVAVENEKIVGHILLTRITINNNHEQFESLSLAPVSVLPAYQKKGIGTKLINQAHETAKSLEFGSVILIGHEDYYPRFGYKKAEHFEIQVPFEVPKINCMALELYPDSLKTISGMVEYPLEFFN